MIAQLLAEQTATGFCITPNARILGRLSGVLRQIDILIEPRHSPNSGYRSIVEAKRLERKIHVKDVENLLGMMDDVGAHFGYLVCPTGYSDAALRRAQDTVRICLVPLDRIAEFDPTAWPSCKAVNCQNGRIFWDGFPQVELTVRKIDSDDLEVTMLPYPQKVGKCESCSIFHAQCLTCNDILMVPHDDESDFGVQCSCRLPWFWIGSVEPDDQGLPAAELHLVSGSSHMMTVNRRPL